MTEIMNHLANVGPLGMSLMADNLKSYESGIFDGCSYDDNIDIDHAV